MSDQQAATQTQAVSSSSSTAATSTSSSSSQSTATLTAASGISSMEDLKNESPEVYQQMLQGIGMNICNEMKKHQDRLKQIMAEARRNNQG